VRRRLLGASGRQRVSVVRRGHRHRLN
jgi:hypothetical protein